MPEHDDGERSLTYKATAIFKALFPLKYIVDYLKRYKLVLGPPIALSTVLIIGIDFWSHIALERIEENTKAALDSTKYRCPMGPPQIIVLNMPNPNSSIPAPTIDLPIVERTVDVPAPEPPVILRGRRISN